VYLVVVLDLGASGILLGTFGTGVVFLLYRLWEERRRLSLAPDVALLRRMLRFGLPTMPAELSLYSLNFIDRIILVRFVGLAEAGLYALAIKFANAMQVLARGFQLAFPPLAYSIQDDDEARRAYALVVTWFAAVLAFAVTGLWLLSRWIVRLLAAPDFFSAHEAIGLLATGIALYALYLTLVVILGRTRRTELNFPAAAAATAANVALNLALVPPLGIVGAALALVGSYLVVLALMYALTRRLFPVPYEWARLALVVGTAAALVGFAEAVVPTAGAGGLALRVLLWAAYPPLLLACGFLTRAERERLRELLRPQAVAARLRALRAPAAPAPAEGGGGLAPHFTPEAYEQAVRDEDRGGA
jgi:O-antigen/teichoic acid export membrane protein